MIPSPTLRERLLAGLRQDRASGCWVWVGGCSVNGTRGVIKFNANKTVNVHRAAAFLWLGLGIEDRSQYACHVCDRSLCCRPHPDHLYVGTASTNLQDAYERDQRVPLKGTANGRCKLTERQVNEIRKHHENGQSYTAIAHAYGVGRHQVARIVRGESR